MPNRVLPASRESAVTISQSSRFHAFANVAERIVRSLRSHNVGDSHAPNGGHRILGRDDRDARARRLRGEGGNVVFTFADAYGTCEESVRSRSGNAVILTRTDTIDGSCGIVRVQSQIVCEFTETSVSGTATHQYTLLSGACSNVPCSYQLAIGGSRCDGCWPGCTAAASAPAVLLPGEDAVPTPFDFHKP
jgi:hypothetical protein